MQTKNDFIKGDTNLNLTVSPPLPLANLEGNLWEEMVEEYENMLKREYPYHLEFLTLSELKEYHELDHWLSLKFNQQYSFTKYQKEQRYEELVEKLDMFYIAQKTEEDFQKWKHQKILEKRAGKSVNRHELGASEFTFTYSPKWFDDSEARLRMSTGINKLLKYYKNDILIFRAVGEVGTNGLSHIHAIYKLRGGLKISEKNFRRAYSVWNVSIKQGRQGHQGGHHANVRSEADFQGYIDKDILNAWFEVAIDNTADPR